MRIRLAFPAILIGAWALASGPAAAFQQTELPAPVLVPPAAVQPGEPLTFDRGDAAPTPPSQRRGGGSFGLGGLKLDFGLELLYGPSPNDGLQAAPTEPAPSDDMTVLGRVKRRF